MEWLTHISKTDNGFVLLTNIDWEADENAKKFGIKYDHWVDEDGFDNDVTYFKVNGIEFNVCGTGYTLFTKDDPHKAIEEITKILGA